MTMKRVVVTGIGGITPLGHDWTQIESRLRAFRNAARRMPEWDYFDALNSRLGCPVDDFKLPDWPRGATGGCRQRTRLARCRPAWRCKHRRWPHGRGVWFVRWQYRAGAR